MNIEFQSEYRIDYARGYFRGKKMPIDPLSETEARHLHDSHENYVAIVYKSGRPFCFVEVSNGSVGVGYLDGLMREYKCLSFVEEKHGLLFLNRLVEREYDGDADCVKIGRALYFSVDGVTISEEVDFKNKERITGSSKKPLGVSWHWVPLPGFGDYEELIRLADRNLSV